MSLKPVMTAEAVAAFWDEHFPQIQKARDITILSIAPGEAVLRLDAGERHLRPGGTVSGPTLVTLADVTAYAALLAHVGPEPMIVTTNINDQLPAPRRPRAAARDLPDPEARQTARGRGGRHSPGGRRRAHRPRNGNLRHSTQAR